MASIGRRKKKKVWHIALQYETRARILTYRTLEKSVCEYKSMKKTTDFFTASLIHDLTQ